MHIFEIPCHIHSLINLIKAQYYTPKRIKVDQEKKLQRVIKRVYEHVPYYKKLFDKNFIVFNSIKTLDDLKIIPITTRSDIQQLEKKEVVADDVGPGCCYNYKTGGSTGTPLNIYISNLEMRRRHIAAEFMYFSNGFGLVDRTLRIFEKKYDKPRNLLNKLGLMDRRFFVLDAPSSEVVSTMRCWKPNLLISYPSKILELAKVVSSQDIAYSGLKGIFTSGEVMTQRERGIIEKVFGAEVYDYYSANECGMIGWECNKHSGLHINTTDLIVEVVDCNGNPTAGEGRVIVTTLSAYAMPFVRYDLGDIGKLSQQNCTCGRTAPLIEGILGRALEFIKIPDELVNPWHFTNAIETYPGISKYQIIQDSDKHLEIKIVKNEKFNPDIAKGVINACSTLVKNKLSVNIKIVSDLPEGNEDKYITVKSVCDRKIGNY